MRGLCTAARKLSLLTTTREKPLQKQIPSTAKIMFVFFFKMDCYYMQGSKSDKDIKNKLLNSVGESNGRMI